eukprot:RCo029735
MRCGGDIDIPHHSDWGEDWGAVLIATREGACNAAVNHSPELAVHGAAVLGQRANLPDPHLPQQPVAAQDELLGILGQGLPRGADLREQRGRCAWTLSHCQKSSGREMWLKFAPRTSERSAAASSNPYAGGCMLSVTKANTVRNRTYFRASIRKARAWSFFSSSTRSCGDTILLAPVPLPTATLAGAPISLEARFTA